MGQKLSVRWGSCIAALLAVSTAAAEEEAARFYAGKTLTMLIGTSAGGDVDGRARMVARHMGRHIPGQPVIVPRNMPGAVGAVAANWLQNVGPRDGTVIHAVMQGMPVHQALGGAGVEFDASKFNWIGNTVDGANVVVVWAASGVRSLDDAKARTVVMGAPGAANNCVFYPLALNALAGTKFRVIAGYPGGNDVNLAMERGEVEGRGCGTWAGWLSTKPEWVARQTIRVLVQGALKRSPDLPDAPTLIDVVDGAFEKAVMRFMSSDAAYSRAFATSPGVPGVRVNALRRAFDATMIDEDFIAEAKKADRELSPSRGEDVQKAVEDVIATPKDVVAYARRILEDGAQAPERTR